MYAEVLKIDYCQGKDETAWQEINWLARMEIDESWTDEMRMDDVDVGALNCFSLRISRDVR